MAIGVGCTSIYRYFLHFLCFFTYYFGIKVHLNVSAVDILKEKLLIMFLINNLWPGPLEKTTNE